MKKILLASAGVMVMSAGVAYAACIPTPSCSSLGYESSSSCEGGIKCPFGNAWNCTVINKVNEITNKVTEIEKVVEEGGRGNSSCQVGYIYHSDKTCSASYITSKTPIGVVVYVDGQGHGQVMALESSVNTSWSNSNTDISSLTNFTTAEEAAQDFASCSNTEKILAVGDKSTYPAAWAAHEYKTEGTNAGDWCLPAAGVFTSYYNNQSLINAGLTNAGGYPMETNSYYWSSSEYGTYNTWYSNFDEDHGLFYRAKNKTILSRPVLEF